MRRAAQDLLIGAAFSVLSGLALLALSTLQSARAGARAISPRAASFAGAPGPDKVASYDIDAKLDTNAHRITAHETIHFVNRSSATLNELWFHLYLNAFKNDRTLFLRSPFGAGRSGDKAHEYGYVDVKKLSIVGGDDADLWPNRDRHSPNDPDDETDLRLPLPSPLEPGASLSLELTFEDQLPEIVERTGYAGSFHFLGQWFPKLARLEPDGQFAHFSFHAQSEFYADFGDYDVTLDVPEGATFTLDVADVALGARGRELRIARVLLDAMPDFARSVPNVAALYALAPPSATSSAPLGVHITNAAGLPASAAVDLYILDDDYRPLPPTAGIGTSNAHGVRPSTEPE